MTLRSTEGLTLVELIIVLAIIAVIGAILVPNLITTTDKAKLKSDIQSARVIESAIELYEAEQSQVLDKSSMDTVMTNLKTKGYLNNTQGDIQTDKAVWTYDTTKKTVVVNIASCDNKIKSDTYGKLSEQEKKLVAGGIS